MENATQLSVSGKAFDLGAGEIAQEPRMHALHVGIPAKNTLEHRAEVSSWAPLGVVPKHKNQNPKNEVG